MNLVSLLTICTTEPVINSENDAIYEPHPFFENSKASRILRPALNM
jgi:hypothetical protein